MDKTEMEYKIKAMEEELSKLKEQLNKEEKGYFKPEKDGRYYCINYDVIKYDWYDTNIDNICYENANCFETKEEAERVAFEQTLFRKIRRFRDTYDEGVNWNNTSQKYYIHYDYRFKRIAINYAYTYRSINEIYFNSKEVAERCLEEFRDELEKYFTENC